MSIKKTTFAFCLISAVIILGSSALLYNLSPLFSQVNNTLETNKTIVMNGELDSDLLSNLLINGNYITDSIDAKFISEWYKQKIESGKPLENLGAINGDRFKIPIDSVRKYGGSVLNARIDAELIAMGQDSVWQSIDKTKLQSVYGHPDPQSRLIQVFVGSEIDKLLGGIPRCQVPVEGVTVRLTEHWINDGIPSRDLPVSHESRILGYAVTDAKGIAKFYVPEGKHYSVVPIAEGFQYGREQGTVNGPLVKDLDDLKFTQREHSIRPFRTTTYQLLKADRALISRTPDDFTNKVKTGIFIFLTCWALVFVVIFTTDSKAKSHTDMAIPLCLMVLCGFGLLALYGQMMPLTDIFYAYKMVDIFGLRVDNFSGGIVIGCIMMILLSLINYRKLYQRYLSRWTKSMGFGQTTWKKMLPGLPFILIAILLMILLKKFGSGPEGSDAKVNLLGIQPSEVVKYLTVIFMAFFFSIEGDIIKEFGNKSTILSRRRYPYIVGSIVIVIIAVCLLFLAMLKDMGPGLVILATFIFLYSLARRDFKMLMLGIFSYVLIVGLAYMLSDIALVRCVAIVAWFIIWMVFCKTKYKTIYESAIFFNLLVSLFLIGGYILRPFLPHMADRLDNRTGMAWSGIFENTIPQGDQIAQGLWGTASGGFSGMGIGGGSPYFIPAGHTDLIMNSLGEQMGWLGILIIAISLYVLISRAAAASQYSGHKFSFYLCLGLGLITAVQFLFIALGCVGALPLSGVPVPFLSYSGTSVALALAAFGIVISISRHRGANEALKSFVPNDRVVNNSYENKEAKSLISNLRYLMALIFAGVVCVVSFNGYYQMIVPAKTKLRPILTATSNGLIVQEYNPRIAQVLGMLERGNIYDRNGLLLATSNVDSLKSYKHKSNNDLLSLGIDIDQLEKKRLRRYYPFGNHAVFMVGDVNRPDIYSNFSKSPIGYFAENEKEDILSGFEFEKGIRIVSVDNYKFNRFVNPIKDTLHYVTRDFSPLLPALAVSPYRSPWIEQYNANRERRDLALTIDMNLQARLQNEMDKYIKTNMGHYPYLRASVVVLDAQQGDLFASANYPLPDTESILQVRDLKLDSKDVPSEFMNGLPISERDLGLTFQSAPGSTAKIMTAMAGLNKKDAEAYNQGFEIKPFMNVEKAGDEPNTATRSKNRNGGEKHLWKMPLNTLLTAIS